MRNTFLTINRFSFQSYLAFIVQRPALVLSVVALVTLLFSCYLPRLSFKTTIYDLIIEDLPEAVDYHKFRALFGSDEIIRIAVKAEDILDPVTFAKVTQLSDAAGQIQGVRRVISLPEVKKTVDLQNQWPMAKFSTILSAVDLFRRNLISEDHQTTIITLVLADASDKAGVIAAVETLISDQSEFLSIYQIGIPLVSEALAQYTQQDFFHLTPVTLLVIAVLLLVLFRNYHFLLLPLSSVLIAIIWTFGYMAWKAVAVSMLTIIVPVLIIAVGTAYCLHICSEFARQVAKRPDTRIACRATLGHMAFPVTLAVLTTMLGIGSLAINEITAIREFAEFACFGIGSLLVVALTFLPVMLTLLPLPKFSHQGASARLERLFDRFLHRVIDLNLNYQKPCLFALGTIALICCIGLFFIRVETNPVSFFKSSTPVSRNFHNIYRQMSGSFPIHIVMSGPVEDYFETPANVVVLDNLQRFLETLPGVDKTVSFADYLKLVNYASNQFDSQFYVLPEDDYEMRMLINNFKSLLGNDLLQGFMSPDLRQANILMLTHISSSRQFLQTQTAILNHVNTQLDHDLTWQVTGLGVVIAASSQLITMGQVKSLCISLILIFAVMVTLFVSSKVGFIAVVPNLFPILVNFGLMGWLGIPLSVATSLIASIAIGLAVDDTIHYLVRYNVEFKEDLNKDRAMRDTILAVGRPVLYTSLTIGIGFSVLMFSHFQPTAVFGLLMVITMVSALIGDMILLPTLMMHVELVTAWDLLKMMTTMGTMSPGMVHELNQPLNAIKLGNDVIKMMIKKGAPLKVDQIASVTREIGRQITRASQMIERFSQSESIPGFDKTLVHLNQPVMHTLDLMEHQFKLDSIAVETRLAPDLPPIMAHHNRLVQVIYNILTNAREAVEARRVCDTSAVQHKIVVQTFMDKQCVVLSIEDTGIGIDELNVERVFDPFFTTKESGKGKGLGLTICRQIVRDCGGRITIEPATSQGTIVTISFIVPPEA